MRLSGSNNPRLSIIGSPMSSGEMEKSRDEDVVNLFEVVDDSTGWDHPRKGWRCDPKSGGVIQASRELMDFSEKNPHRAVRLISSFNPKKQEVPAGTAIEGLAKSNYESNNLYQIILELNERGFTSSSFRISVAHALEIRAKQDNGLPLNMIELLENWIPQIKEPLPDNIRERDSEKETETLLWEHGGFYSLPGGRDRLYDAIALGYLLQKPQNVKGWFDIIERTIDYEKHPNVWESILRFTKYLFADDRKSAAILLDKIISQFDTVKFSKNGVRALADAIRYVPDSTITRKWLTAFLDSDLDIGQHAFGEISMWYLFHNPKDSDIRQEIFKRLKDPQSILIHRGVAAAASNNWHYQTCQNLCTDVLEILAQSIDKITISNISKVFQYGSNVTLNPNMKRIINSFLPNDLLIKKCAERLVEGITYATAIEPKLVNNICNRVLDTCGSQIGNIASSHGFLAEPIVSISITLQRLPMYREDGLKLFERLIESNIEAAEQAT